MSHLVDEALNPGTPLVSSTIEDAEMEKYSKITKHPAPVKKSSLEMKKIRGKKSKALEIGNGVARRLKNRKKHSSSFDDDDVDVTYTEMLDNEEEKKGLECINDGFINEEPPRNHPNSKLKRKVRKGKSILSVGDVEIMQRLDDEYERALEEREVGWTA
eukprot:976463-Ditylum_brightwellii.AAC.1